MSDLKVAHELLKLAKEAVLFAKRLESNEHPFVYPELAQLQERIEGVAECLEPVCHCGERRAHFLHLPAESCEGCKCPRDHHEFAPETP